MKKNIKSNRTMTENTMKPLDLKDRKILYHLDLNCRQSNTQIGKKVGLKKDLVSYRINKMQKEGLITNFWTAVNTLKLGYYAFRIYINFLDVSAEIRNKIISYFKKCDNIWALLTAKGPVDLDVVLWVDDIYQFNRFWDKTLEQYGKYFGSYTVSILTQSIACKKSYLLPENIRPTDRVLTQINCSGSPIKIDEVDYKILNRMALNARIPLIELAEQLNCSSQTVNYRIQNLMKKGIILAYRVNIDISKLGLQDCAIDIYLKDPSKKKEILNYVITNPYVYDLMDMNVGWCDLSFQMVVKSIDTLIQLVDEIEQHFPNAIRKHNFWMSTEIHKERWLPEMFKS